MSTVLYRLGGWTAAHPWRTIAGWLAALALAVVLSMTMGGQTHDDYRVDGSPAQAGADFLAEHFDGSFDSSARVLVHNSSALDQPSLVALSDRLGALPHVTGVEPPVM